MVVKCGMSPAGRFLTALRSMAGVLPLALVTLGACTGVRFEEPTLVMNLKYQDVQSSQLQSALTVNSVSLAAQEDPVTAEELPKTLTRDFDGREYCFVVNTLGAGVPSLFRDRLVTCENAFPGFGQITQPFEWGQIAQNPAAILGSVRFDVIGFNKSFYGGHCPQSLSFAVNAESQLVMLADGKTTTLSKGLESLNPVFLSKAQVAVQPGPNQVDMQVFQSGVKPVGKLYGCQEFKMFPELNSDQVLRTGMKKLFFKVDCPQEADKIQVETAYGTLLGDAAVCDVKGQAFIKLAQPSNDDLMASEYDWYLPSLVVNAYQGEAKIAQIPFKLKYSKAGRYPSLKDFNGSEEVAIPLTVGDDQFEIAAVSVEEIRIQVRNSGSGFAAEYLIPVEAAGPLAMAWSGQEARVDNLGSFELNNPFEVFKGGILAQVQGAFLNVLDCSHSANCDHAFKGVKANRDPASLSQFDVSISNKSKKLVSVGVSAGQVVSSVYDLAGQPWVDNGFAEAVQKYSANLFVPAWNVPHVNFVKSLEYDVARDGIKSPFKDNVVVGGTMEDPYTGAARAVMYRSPNGGKNWYRVYLGAAGTRLVDAKTMPMAFHYGKGAPVEQAGFVLLERRNELDVQGHVSDVGELRVLVQDQHGF